MKSKEGKSDDEEFEEAERSVKRRKQEKGSESDSDHDYDVVDDHNGSEKGEAEYSGSSSQVKDGPLEGGEDEQKSGEDNTADDEDEIEEVRYVIQIVTCLMLSSHLKTVITNQIACFHMQPTFLSP